MNIDSLRTANKGEWAELYVFFKIASEGIVYAADRNLKLKSDEYYNFLRLFRQNKTKGRLTYDLTEKGKVHIYNEIGQRLGIIEDHTLSVKTSKILERIKAAHGTFSIPEANTLMNEYQLTGVKSPSNNKADIEAFVQTVGTPTAHEMGFSIKSYIGGSPTLVNSSAHTNFIYEVVDFQGQLAEVNDINTRRKVRDRIAMIRASGGKLIFHDMESSVYKANLRMQDSNYPLIMARMLQYFYEGNGYELETLGAMVATDSDIDASTEEICHKTKHFLRSSALGMVPASTWDTRLSTQGGYIVLFNSGDLACYSLYYDDDFRDYLYANTRFDTPSTTKYKFGHLYSEKGKLFIKLNLQIRFK